ncbi:MAG: inositol-3-phosphate synthase [Lentimicrobium sp.]|jgi:myo-inositol-1-phosphate synthase|nr:inositol-3-phosphate synthase [Lentimicrobium sp.]MDD2527535.1 inositol-3-phosphate synthase [Lentimicrobiaceae bacterium]MDD4596699.1 inositol-3-phosphate synthase [Lentimicrobiaceae bacterium]MDY0024932.1 inositol-3-phosphate synthase [Lentimicrobium sp.]HAH58390.1 inositol-3-phosphate synthase [Bacteroidales bacterium]
MNHKKNIQAATGKLGILIPGLGAVSTTFIAGSLAARKGAGKPIGSITQMGRIRLGKRTENRNPAIKEFVPLASLDDLVFGGWDITPDNAFEAAMNAGVLDKELLIDLKGEMESIKPMTAVFDHKYVKNLDGEHIKREKTKMDSAKALMADIEKFKAENGCSRLVMIWCASTEIFVEQQEIHQSIDQFERALESNHPGIAPSMIYAYAAIKSGVPFVNGAPNLTCDVPAIVNLANELNVPIAGKDFKTGQTLMKTILGPGLKTRLIGIDGWFSTNILGNRDGKVLDDADSFKTKEVSKLSVLESILEPDTYPELYKDMYHKVRINYYPPKGDDKESWDNIDIFGWLGYKMQIKVNFLCKDSILAAPVVLDLALFMDLAQRVQMKGIQEWLSFYFKSPQTLEGLQPIHDIFLQKIKLENTLRYLMGETLINHLGLDYYQDQE